MSNFLTGFDNFKREWKISSDLALNFKIQYSADIFNPNNHDLLEVGDSERKIIVIDQTVYKLYKKYLINYFKINKASFFLLSIEASEENKDWRNIQKILLFFEKNKILRRSEPIIAIGGGVLLDMVGFACSIYRRGIPYVKVPTTLLAIVDVSVGAKVAVNHFDRRNRIGSYYPAETSLIDKKFIESQDHRNIKNGIAEIFKLAIIKDAELFDLLDQNAGLLIRDKFQYGAVPVRVINLAISGMVDELAPNLWEKNLKRCVDFGHSFSPIIEMKNLPKLFHGEAVVLDCLFSACISHARKILPLLDLKKIFEVAKKLELPSYHKDFTNKKLLFKALEDTMKHRNNNQYLPIPIKIGNYKFINNLNMSDLTKSIAIFSNFKGKS